MVTPVGTDQCGMKEIMNPPVFPIVADGMLAHTNEFNDPQSFSFQLPAGMTCASNCVLQVTEYMQNHAAPCFYHHCANIMIEPGGDGGTITVDAAGADAGGADDGGTHADSGGGADSGCSCTVAAKGSRASIPGVLAMLLVGAAFRRRRGVVRTCLRTRPRD
jgi:MYXO-CTERM domain-containing protein